VSKHDLPNVRAFRPNQRKIAARDLNALRDAGLATLREATPPDLRRPRQIIVKLAEAIAANASGEAVQAYWDSANGVFDTFGPTFEVVNMGPSTAPADSIVPVTLGQSHLLFFQYTAAAAWAGYKHMIRAGAPTAWTFDNSQWVTLPCSSEILDTGGAFNTGTYKFTVPAGDAGIYYVHAQMGTNYCDANTTDTVWLRIVQNSSERAKMVQGYTGGGGADERVGLSIATLINLAAADTVSAEAICSESSQTWTAYGDTDTTQLVIFGPLPDGS
jgi:hypothetical protein